MPVDGLSLLGFMERSYAHHYLETLCAVEGGCDQEHERIWQEARGQLGPPIDRAGNSVIQDVPNEHRPHLEKLVTKRHYAEAIKGFDDNYFALVGIDPLLAYQFHIYLERSEQHVIRARRPSLGQVLKQCLPLTVRPEPQTQYPGEKEILITSPSTNLGFSREGLWPERARSQTTWFAGALFGPASPLVQVARHNDRYYLRNGFHRAYMLRQAGIGVIPCIVLVSRSFESFAGTSNGRFSQQLLESDNPPTVGHYAQNRAYKLKLRKATKLIRVNWSETIIFEET